jgi:hypothetical protein
MVAMRELIPRAGDHTEGAVSMTADGSTKGITCDRAPRSFAVASSAAFISLCSIYCDRGEPTHPTSGMPRMSGMGFARRKTLPKRSTSSTESRWTRSVMLEERRCSEEGESLSNEPWSESMENGRHVTAAAASNVTKAQII